MYRRLILGLISIALLATGAILYFIQPASQGLDVFGAACVRVGVAMSALWLAYPDLQRIPVWMSGALLVVVAIVAVNPKLFSRLIVVVLVVYLAFWMLRPRVRKAQADRPRQ